MKLFKLADGTTKDISEIEGMNEYLNSDTTYTHAIVAGFKNGAYSYLEGKQLESVVDLGGNIGLFSLFVSPIAKKIYTVEPDGKHFAQLTKTLSDVKNVILYNNAIWDKNEDLKFYRCNSNSSANTCIKNDMDLSLLYLVKAITLKSIINNETIDFCKMDIEASEKILLTDDSFPFDQIKIIEVSIHTPHLNGEAIKNKLEAEGFVCEIYHDDYGMPVFIGRNKRWEI